MRACRLPLNVAIIHKEGYRRKFKERRIEIARKEGKREEIDHIEPQQEDTKEGRES